MYSKIEAFVYCAITGSTLTSDPGHDRATIALLQQYELKG